MKQRIAAAIIAIAMLLGSLAMVNWSSVRMDWSS